MGSTPNMEDRDFYTVPELALIAFVCRATVYTWIKRGWLKAYRMGGHQRVSKTAWQDFLAR